MTQSRRISRQISINHPLRCLTLTLMCRRSILNAILFTRLLLYDA